MAFNIPEKYRVNHPNFPPTKEGDPFGLFVIPSPEPSWYLIIIAGGDTPEVPESLGWDHVSVRAEKKNKSRIPNWKEMCIVKDLFWKEDDTVVQFHPKKNNYINNHPHVLHLWHHDSIIEPNIKLV